ncbi:hypothetical protein [Commensalibacter nepenthis]|uniref:Secreted protein n=1 Tax=Commensalibacter nepenthis TaxID=3043872 RepID=A0ABT6Q5U5_9PROT|nr:hypothetical protein [Commensalibacter sp. TBRC 10068]MDI2112132.1 hypothetical protein [Commensalibacter sp. TBRC 10068]
MYKKQKFNYIKYASFVLICLINITLFNSSHAEPPIVDFNDNSLVKCSNYNKGSSTDLFCSKNSDLRALSVYFINLKIKSTDQKSVPVCVGVKLYLEDYTIDRDYNFNPIELNIGKFIELVEMVIAYNANNKYSSDSLALMDNSTTSTLDQSTSNMIQKAFRKIAHNEHPQIPDKALNDIRSVVSYDTCNYMTERLQKLNSIIKGNF